MKRKTQHNSDDECRSVASNSFMLKQDFAALLDESPSQIFFQVRKYTCVYLTLSRDVFNSSIWVKLIHLWYETSFFFVLALNI